MNKLGNLIPTIVIVVEVQAEIRGYPLQGREFVLKEPQPRKDTAVTADGAQLPGDYWVVSKEEYMRVVPEATRHDLEGDEVYIPTFVARLSWRPGYLKSSAKTLF